ncbi:MAG: alpha/beta hydrolase family protein [Pirellulales bacterium]
MTAQTSTWQRWTTLWVVTIFLWLAPELTRSKVHGLGMEVETVFSVEPPATMLTYFQEQAKELAARQTAPENLEAWQQRRIELRRQLWQSLGHFPLENRSPPKARLTGRIDHGDHWVEKIVYQSLPGLYVTALAYVPKNPSGRVPAVLCLNGHWTGAKAEPRIQKRCQMLARMGVIAFCQDVIGTGERAAFDGAEPVTYHGFYRGATPRIVDRSLLGYILYECMRAVDYLQSRGDVDPRRILCTGASGGGKQSMFLPALDDRLAGSVPVCYLSSYQAHMGATACVGEIPTGILRYSNQWEILGLHAPRPLLCIAATRDVPVFQPQQAIETLDTTAQRLYRLYEAQDQIKVAVIESGHDYNRPMRKLLYQQVANRLLNNQETLSEEPAKLPAEPAENLQCGLPSNSETMRSLTWRRAQELVGHHQQPANLPEWSRHQTRMLAQLETEVLGSFPDISKDHATRVRTLVWQGYRVEHWKLEPETNVIISAALCFPHGAATNVKKPAILVVDELGKQKAFSRGLVSRLLQAGHIVLAIDTRGTGETAGTVPAIGYGPGTPEYNLSNYALLLGRPLVGMRALDIRCAIDLLVRQEKVDTARITVVGRGRAALAGLLASLYDSRIHSLVAEELLASWVFAEEFNRIGLCYLVPQILTIGDMQHLAACLAPRDLLMLNPVDGRRRLLTEAATREQFSFTENVYQLHADAEKLQRMHVAPEQSVDAMVDWITGLDKSTK